MVSWPYLQFISRFGSPNLFWILDKFAIITGLEVNQAKSRALNVSLPQQELNHLQDHFPFTWSTSSMPYLRDKTP